MVDFGADLLGGHKYERVFEAWFNQPEFRPLIVIVIGICVIGALVIWWFKYKI
ncbi:MAG: hypothetical protein Q7R82_00825 [Candidatus Daviesbacteria bacterium]|nr:hypothetical protein [Candidatus Daviesbacteria bacterium]